MSRRCPALDRFRLLSAVLVVMIHTSPLSSYTALGDFLLTRVLSRVAVPFFFMVSGYFLAKDDYRSAASFLKKTALLYAAAILVYLPLNCYAGQLSPDFLRRVVTDGTFYHLWYFPALLLGVPIARRLYAMDRRTALALAAALYLIGLGGDSYYGLFSRLPLLKAFYEGFFHLFSYTRNGLFFAPLFLLLGGYAVQLTGRLSRRLLSLLLPLSLSLMALEALCLRRFSLQRHDSMYLLLPLVMALLFSLLLRVNGGRQKALRDFSLLLYLLHPWCIVLVRGAAELTGLEGLFVANSLGHFFAVLLLSSLLSLVLPRLRPLPISPKARAWREIDLAALAHNAALLTEGLAPGQELMAVVKADAYGHGAVQVARCLRKKGVRAFAVACLSEAVALRKAGIRGLILILGYTSPEDAPLLRRWRLTQAVADLSHGRALAAQGCGVHVHLALDTGMHRLGIPAEDQEGVLSLFQEKGIAVDGMFSHLCVSDSLSEGDDAYTQRQLRAFYGAAEAVRAAGYDPGALHIQSSYGLLNLPPQPCRYARAGILLYGVLSDRSPTLSCPAVRPVLSLRCRVASIRTLRGGEAAGYGLAFRAQRETRLALLTIGYGDGLPRELPQRGGRVLLHGRSCPMVGRMCMDQLFVDVTDVPEAAAGDVATLIGCDGAEALSAVDLAVSCGTLTNELLSQLQSRLPLLPIRS